MRLVKLALLVTLVAAVPASAQEPPLPEGAIAHVGDELVPATEFDLWYPLLAAQTPWLLSDPPDYDRCIATLAQRAAKHGRHPTRRSLRGRCADRAEQTRDFAMGLVLQDVWLRQEAARVGVSLTLPEIARTAARYKREMRAKDRRAFRRAGITDAQFARAVVLSMRFERLIERVRARLPEVTQARVERYYTHHRYRYRHVSRRRALERVEVHLKQERAWRATARFITKLFKRYGKRTQCAEGYVVELCANSESDGSDEDVMPSRGRLTPL